MTSQRWNTCCWSLGLATSLTLAWTIIPGNCAFGQIIPDTTLGTESSVVTPNVNDLPTSQIDNGAIRGANLFHSFEQFSLPTGGTAYFNNPSNIQNIISRVTGASISNIDGLLRANGTANLFLLNPNGIIFGPNASLNIGGSFLASTANSLKFSDGIELSTTATQATPLLTISEPVGLGFGEVPQEIVNRSGGLDNNFEPVGLQVLSGKTLALVGGRVSLEGGFLTTPGGQIELGSVAGNNSVGLTLIDQSLALNYEGIQNFQDINLSQAAFIGSYDFRGADIQIQGRRLIVTEGSQVASTAREGQAGNLKVSASESVELVGTPTDLFPTGLFNRVVGDATGEGRTLSIETGKLIVQGGAYVEATTGGAGRASDLMVRVTDLVELSGTSATGTFSSLGTSALETATGNAGDLTIETRRLTVQDGAQVQAATRGAGRAGNLLVRATDSVELSGTSAFDSSPSGLATSAALETATGNAGDLTIETGRLIIQGGAQVVANTLGTGQGGTLTINASDFIELSGALTTADLFGGSSGFFVSAEPGATGNVGDLRVTTRQLTVQNGAKISADNFGPGQGGTVTVNVRQLIVRDGGLVRAGSLIKDGSLGEGPGGTLTINASESVEVSGTGTIGLTPVNSTLFTQAEGTGDAGNLNIKTGSLNIRDGADITVSSIGSGNAGELTVEAASIELDNSAVIATTFSGNGGDITLKLQQGLLLLRHNSAISSTAGNAAFGGDGGNITIDTPFIVASPSENSDITANAFSGSGGRVNITAQAIFGLQPLSRQELQTLLGSDSSQLDPSQLRSNDITAISQTDPALSGQVTLNTPDVDPSRGLVTLPTNLIDASSLIAQSCRGSGKATASEQNQFIVTGRGGLPLSPSEALSSQAVWQDLRPPVRQAANRSISEVRRSESDMKRVPQPSSPIVEAQGWVIGTKGEVILTAQASSLTPHIPWLKTTTCDMP